MHGPGAEVGDCHQQLGATFCWPAGASAAAVVEAVITQRVRRSHLVIAHPALTLALWEGSGGQFKLRLETGSEARGICGGDLRAAGARGDWLVWEDGRVERAGPQSAMPTSAAVAPILAAGLRAASSAAAVSKDPHQAVRVGAPPLPSTGIAEVAGVRYGLRRQWLITVGGPMWDCPMSGPMMLGRPAGGPSLIITNDEDAQHGFRTALFIEPSGRLTRRCCAYVAPGPHRQLETAGWIYRRPRPVSPTSSEGADTAGRAMLPPYTTDMLPCYAASRYRPCYAASRY
eukprot:SAG31_NODE_2155_length_6311_cov_3.139086_5_plen_287_part_00